MKKLSILLSFMVLCLIANSENTIQLSNNCIIQTEKDSKIDLSGNFPSTGTRSVFEPIILMQYSGYLEVEFSNNFGIILIEIKDKANNTIYHDAIDTNSQKHYQLFLSGYENGSCYIKFTNSQGRYLEGTFVIQR